ncbi:MAG: alpha-L-fucosidase [Ignavibacteriae bacterium]|nr:alpha-L-fucosidase [Ignavibacteriota bacterium]MCB9208901.1 alpha-L-fucosidase [Ignavibacteriales bacterium]MCB9218181.1 alpha-L-fucosidase [Ignavibacteriales bacterium]
MKKIVLMLLFIIVLGNVTKAQLEHEITGYVPETDPLVIEKLEQWQDLKFGLLMHWGTYSQWGIVESWSICPEDYGWCERKKGSNPENYFEYKKEYENLQTTFNPTKFDPDKWAKAAKNAGMKYVVFTTKHHDGFSMFDSKYTDYKITSEKTPFHTNPKANVTKEIFNSFRNEGLWAGAYFSKPDWNSPYYWDPYFPPLDRNVNYDPELYPEKWSKFVDFTHNQIMELLTDYGKVDILWLDGGWVAAQKNDIEGWYSRVAKRTPSGFLKSRIVNQDIKMDELVEKARKAQPGLIVVDRAVKGKNQNYLTPENKVPEYALPYPWESCIIAGGGWGWVFNPKYKPSHELVHMLVDIVCKGGNLLLNIGPSPEGLWPDDAYDRLNEIGKWMDVNNEAIYGTRAIAPYKESKICYTNKKNTNTVYAIYMADEDETTIPEKILISSFSPKEGSKINLLGYDKPIPWENIGNGTLLTIPKDVQNNPTSKYAWAFKINEIEK